MSFWPSDAAGRISDVCSVLGLVATAVLTTGALQVRRQLYTFPQHAAKLNAHCKAITTILNDYSKNINAVEEEIGKLKGDLNSLKRYLRGEKKQTLINVVGRIDDYEKVKTEKNLRDLNKIMYQLATEMQNLSRGL